MILSTVRRREARRVCDAAKAQFPSAFLAIDSAPGPGSVVSGNMGTRV